jgi:hypothetical protein
LSNDRYRKAAVAALIVGGIAAAASAAADDLFAGLQTPHTSWSMFAGASRTDNATLVANNAMSDTIATAGVNGSLYRDTGRLRADLGGSVRYEDYLHHTFTSHTLGSLVGTASYAIVPDRLDWVLQDTYGQVGTNPLAPTTPTNRINVNAVSTGPDARLHLGGATELLISGRYAQTDFESIANARQVNDRQVTGQLGLLERLSRSSSVSLNVSGSRVEYPVAGSPSYNQDALYGRFDSRFERGGVALDLGVSQLRENGTSVRAPVAHLTLFRRLTPSWNVNVTAGTDFRNSGQAFQAAFTGKTVVNGQLVPGRPPGTGAQPGAGVADVNLTQTPFRSSSGSVAFDYVRPRSTFGVSAGVIRERYQFGGSGLDRNLAQSSATFTRRMRPTLDFHATANYWRREPQPGLPADRTWTSDVGLDWRAGGRLGVTLAYFHQDRSVDAGGFGYRENRVYLGLSYGSGRSGGGLAPAGQSASPAGP